MKARIVFAGSLIVVAPLLVAETPTGAPASVRLVDNARVRFHTVLAPDAPAPVRKGAAELVKYLDGGVPGPDEKTLPVEIRVERLPELKKDGFVLDVRTDGITITGWNARGALYGCYEILKKYAGMRWVVPGLNGEYRVGDWKNVSVPVGRQVRNPYIWQRTMSAISPLAAEWQARNNMASVAWGIGLRPYESWMDDFATEGVATGAHCLSSLVLGAVPKGVDRKTYAERLCKEHPEWFPLVGGRRVPIWDDGRSPNPCVSNPATLDRMAGNLLACLKSAPHTCDFPIIIGNNDTTAWCECEQCLALDPPEAKYSRGKRSDRYWHMVNGIAERVWKELPEANIGGWCYQDFWYPPRRVKPNPRLYVQVSFNNQCWRHSVMDPNCAVNKEMRRIYADWKKLGMPYLCNRDEIAAGGSPGCEFEPSETVVAKNFVEYPELGCNGSGFCLYHDDEPYFHWSRNGKFKGRNYFWQAMWQSQYVAALMMWDATVDWKAALEEANELYYGPAAWKGGMKEFRALLTDCFLSTPGCIGWGQGNTVGPCLDRPGAEEKLKKFLDRAVYCAWRSGDGRAIRHVELEREIFEKTWLFTRGEYLRNHKEITAYRLKGKVKVDGVLDEADWKGSDTFSSFTPSSWSQNKENIQSTFVRLAYDDDNLYFAVEAMEAKTGKMVAGDKAGPKLDDFNRLGNHVELFYTYPDMAEAAWHLSVNSKGQACFELARSAAEHDDSIATRAKWAVKTTGDRWTLEVAIPFAEIGQTIMSGATWKINVARERLVDGEKSETSTLTGGQFFGTGSYVNVKFLDGRKGTGATDESAWKNGNFNDVVPNRQKDGKNKWADWKSVDFPRDWYCAADGELVENPAAKGDWCVRYTKGRLGQFYIPQAKGKYRASFRLRGKGTCSCSTVNYADYPPDAGMKGYRHLGGGQPLHVKLTPEWKTYTLDFSSFGEKAERISVNFDAGKESAVDLDDVYITPVK